MKLLLHTITFLLLSSSIWAQSTGISVYQILEAKCGTCHNSSNPTAGLDLVGSGNTEAERWNEVYTNIVGVVPANEYASTKGFEYIYPGRADQSFLFRKINDGLEPTLSLNSAEGNSMPNDPDITLSDKEKELIRQWILYGAPANTEVVSESLLEAYFNEDGLPSFPDGPPEAPAEGEGFQIKMGPYYLAPGGEAEFFSKYELNLPDDIEVNRLDIKISNFSHHFILYNYDPPEAAASVPDGFRLDINHTADVGVTATIAEPTDLVLPAGTAFKWKKDLVLDLNSHYINYSASQVYQAEVYINVYTQSLGTAAQEMYAELVPNPNIYIPNNGNVITHTASIEFPAEIFVWILGGHTHQYGTSYKIWRQTAGGGIGEILYDGACPQGIPGCISPFFDYQHIPPRYFDPIIPVDLNLGIIHEASWVNDGPDPVWWGPTSQDEMMLFGMYFLTDTTGLGVITDVKEPATPVVNSTLEIFPNPANNLANILIPNGFENSQIVLQRADGSVLLDVPVRQEDLFEISVNHLPQGIYFVQLVHPDGQIRSGKLLITP